MSETEFLEGQAELARQAIADTIQKMRESLKDAADVRAWARSYPWTTMGVAAAAGFLAANAAMPKRRPPEDEEPALLEKILADEQIAARIKELAEGEEIQRKGSGLLRTAGMTLLRTLGPSVQSAITAALAARSASQSAAQESDDDSNETATSAADEDVT